VLLAIISGLFRVAAKGWIRTYKINTIKIQCRTKPHHTK